jgi:peptidoglycan/LPS O-acetylase OafA/YrhL
MSTTPRVFGLDLMRAIAITMVVAGHAAWIFPDLPPPVSMLASLSAFFGVEIFFVLSGFLIGRIMLREFTREDFGRASVKNFLMRRWLRTLPAYFVVLLLNIWLATWLNQEMGAVWRDFFMLQNLAWPMPYFFPESWSLSVEEFAYVLLPLVLLVFQGGVRMRRFLLVIASVIGMGILLKLMHHFANPSTTMEQWNLGVKAVVLYHFDSIFIGVLAGWLSVKFSGTWKKVRYLATFVGIIGVGFFTAGVGSLGLFIDRVPFFWDVLYLSMVSFSFALFLPMLHSIKTAPRIFAPVSFIALISYSLYLLHYSILLQLFNHWIPSNAGMRLRVFALIVYLVTIVFSSYFLYWAVERPFMRWRNSITRP